MKKKEQDRSIWKQGQLKIGGDKKGEVVIW